MAVSAPNAITQFLAIATAALPTSFQVRYSTTWSPFAAPQALLVNKIHFSEDQYAELGPTYRHEEHYEFTCSLCSWAGDDDEAGRMAEVFGYYTSIQVAVANNPTMNGAVRLAWPRQLDYTPNVGPQGGSIGQLDFEIECQQRVDSLD